MAHIKRKHIRFTPDPNTMALIDSNFAAEEFHPEHFGLTLTESFSGSSAIIKKTEKLQKNDFCLAQVGKIGPLKARIAWREEIDDEAIKIGIEFLE